MCMSDKKKGQKKIRILHPGNRKVIKMTKESQGVRPE
jgi:hypothetical protein